VQLCYSALNRSDRVCPCCKIEEVVETGKQAVYEVLINNPECQNWSGNPNLFLEITPISTKDKNGNVTGALKLAISAY
jgi:hypothetical protein